MQSYVPPNVSYAPNQVEGDAFAYKNLDNYTDLYASCWVKWISFGDSPTLSRVLKLAGPNGDYAISAVGVEDVNGTFEWALHYRDGDEVYHAVANASTPLQLNSWYFVEIYGQVSSASGASEGWINGEKFESVTGIDNQLTGDICQLRAGLEEGGQLTSIAAEDYINDVTVSTSYISYTPYSGPTQPPSPTLSPATKPVLTGTSIIYILLAISATVLVGAVASIIVKRNASRYKPKLEKIENAFPFSLLVLFM